MKGPGWPPFHPALLKKIGQLEFGVRTANCLRNENIVYVGDLVQKTEFEVLRIPDTGRKSLHEIQDVLATMGLHLGMNVEGGPPKNIENLANWFEEASFESTAE